MKRLVRFLWAALALQCVIVAALALWPKDHSRQGPATLTITGLTADALREVHITDGTGNELILHRHGEQWLLPALQGVPANAEMIDKLLAMATEPAALWPVANTPAVHQRFAVSENYFNRRIIFLGADETQASVLLGTSPGFRQVHARNLEHDAVYTVNYNVFDAPTDSAQWLSPDMLQVRAPVSIVADSYSAHYTNGNWQSGSGGTPDEFELKVLLDTLRNLQIKGIASEHQTEALAAAEPEMTFSISSLGGEAELTFFNLQGEYFVRSSHHAYFFGSNAYDFDQLARIDFSLITGTP